MRMHMCVCMHAAFVSVAVNLLFFPDMRDVSF
jgi:hypothetical protein